MQRRTTKAGDGPMPAPISGGKSATTTRAAPRRVPSSSDKDHDKKSSSPAVKLIAMVCAIFLISFLVVSYISPSSVEQAEKQVYEAEQRVESEVYDLFGGGVHEKVVPPIPQHHVEGEGEDLSKISATDAMLQQTSTWVDGEKRLKKKLKKLAELQAAGKELGVPALTRDLGDDIPAWCGSDCGMTVEEWQAKVDAKCAEMA